MDPLLDDALAERLARLALACVTREYPNKVAHLMSSDADVLPPRRLTPAFYGCFDWHSAVHGHWTLARLARLFPAASFAAEARSVLAQNLTAANIEAEAAYLSARPGFERPYGLAWLLALASEVDIRPLAEIAVQHVAAWLPKLPRPDRSCQHSNTAFSLGLMLDAARSSGSLEFERLLLRRARDFYYADRDAPLSYEPSGEDFLSPSLAEADLMRRVLPPSEFVPWLAAFLPDISSLRPVVSPDPSDGKLAHLDGLNLSRAWMLRALGFLALANAHAAQGLTAVTGEHYEGDHWLGTFAVYLLTSAGPWTRIVIVDYDPSWPGLFLHEAGRIRAALGERALRIEHVGSTAVPGLAAKPVIDIVLDVADSAHEGSYIPGLQAAGYSVRIREPNWHEHRILKGPDTDINLHVFSSGCPEIERMLRFRDRLRENEDARVRYANTKCSLAENRWPDVDSYAKAKTAVIEDLLR